MAARTEEEILTAYKDAARLSDETVDVDKGPLYDLVGRPLSKVLNPTEEKVDRLEKIYSSEFAKVATEEEAQAFLDNWGEVAGEGTPASVRVYFMVFTPPRADQVIDIPLGTLVGNFDQSLQYITVEAGQIRGDLASSYYNAQRRSYEIGLLCTAVAVGSSYELPSGRINQKVSALPSIDAVENREATTPGSAAETTLEQIERVQQKFLGLAINTGNGSYTRIKRYAPTSIMDVRTILPTDRRLFKRIVYGPAKDYYVHGTLPKTVVETYKAIGGETEIVIQNVPALSINSVTINAVPITNFTLRSDSSEALRKSAKAQDKLVLAVSLLANDVVSYSVTYNSLIQDVQDNVLNEQQLFNTDELAREFVKIPLRIEITGRALASYDPTEVAEAVSQNLETQITKTEWTEAFYPNAILEEIKRNVSGLTNAQMVRFQRSTGASSQVEIATMEQNEFAVYDSVYVTVQIRSI